MLRVAGLAQDETFPLQCLEGAEHRRSCEVEASADLVAQPAKSKGTGLIAGSQLLAILLVQEWGFLPVPDYVGTGDLSQGIKDALLIFRQFHS